jgi:glycosyltransferase involved in cell wall biosynthesis
VDTRLPWPLHLPRPLYIPWSFARRFSELGNLSSTDLVVFQRPMTELPTLALERRAARGRTSVLDFDDAIFLAPSVRRKFGRLVKLVDHVIAGNAWLAQAAGVPDRTTVIPTVVDTDHFRALPPRDGRGRDVVLGWTGSSVNFRYLIAIAPALARVIQRTGARLRIIADRPPPRVLAGLNPEFVRWRPETEIDDLGAIDIGLMPLVDGAHERGKCAYKLIQYMAVGRVGVASPVGANNEVVTDGQDGFFAKDDADWENVLVRLIADPALRDEVGVRARRRVVDAYSVASVVPRYLELFRRLGVDG